MDTTQTLQRIKSFLVVATTAAGVSRLKKKTRGGVENIVSFLLLPSLSLNFSRTPALKVFDSDASKSTLVEAKTRDFSERVLDTQNLGFM
jgi:hypothetical protein